MLALCGVKDGSIYFKLDLWHARHLKHCSYSSVATVLAVINVINVNYYTDNIGKQYVTMVTPPPTVNIAHT